MSDPVSALHGQVYSGSIRVEDAGPRGMITLRGDHSSAAMTSALDVAGGFLVPEALRVVSNDTSVCLWMSPDELLVCVDYARAADTTEKLSAALSDQHAMVVDVSDARAMLRLSGPSGAIRDALAKLSPADLRPGQLGVGEVRRTRLAQVPAAFWFEDEETAYVICFRSVADYVFKLIKNATQPGAEPGFF